MDVAKRKGLGYSADGRMHLTVNGHVLTIAQLGPDFLILEGRVDHPPAPAEIAVSIDGDETRWPVYLTNGITPDKGKRGSLAANRRLHSASYSRDDPRRVDIGFLPADSVCL